MPFYDYASLPCAEGVCSSDATTLVQWHVREGEFVEADTRIATFRAGDQLFSLIICFPAAIQQRLVPEGATIPQGASVLRWLADGESIPYGKTHFRALKAYRGDAADGGKPRV